MSNGFVCAMGIGTVFLGLIALVFICMIMSAVCKLIGGVATEPKVASKPAAPVVSSGASNNNEIANKGEIIAACCAAIAEELGEEVKNIKVVSFKKA